MEQKQELINKIKGLLKSAELPKRLHKFGPKTYFLWQHVFALFIRAECRLSYRRASSLLRSLGYKVATKSTLQRYAYKLRLPFWRKVLLLTLKNCSGVVSIDGTGLEKTRASEHYIARIDRKVKLGKGYHLSIAVAQNSQIIGLRIRKRYSHDTKDVKYLHKRWSYKPTMVIMDKGYDAEWIHKYFSEHGIISIAPVRKNGRRGKFRKKLLRNFPREIYNKRNRVESVFHALKQKYGSSVSSIKINSARSEVYCRVILYNLFLLFLEVLGQTLIFTTLKIQYQSLRCSPAYFGFLGFADYCALTLFIAYNKA